nr:tetratricopeptide repeat protein [Streptomyces sp. SID4948]
MRPEMRSDLRSVTRPEAQPGPVADTLPPGAARFVGRIRELAELRAEISRPGLAVSHGESPDRARVLLVVGRPGVGRTTTALHLAHQLASRYPDGRFFLRLTGDGGEPIPAEQTVQELLRAVTGRAAGSPPGTPAHRPAPAAPAVPPSADDTGPGPGDANTDRPEPEGDVPAPADAAGALRKAFAGRRVLLVLDDVTDAEQLAGILPETAGSLVVATSGGPLPGIADVRPSTLGGLSTAAGIALLAQALGDTRLTNDPRGAESLVQEAAGHPSALRLIGGWLAAQPRLSLSEAAVRLRAASARSLPAARATDGLAPPELLAQAGSEAPAVTPAKTRTAADDVPAPPAVPGELVRAFRLVYETLPGTAARMLRLLVLAPAGLVDAQAASALAGCSVPAAQSTLEDFVAGGLLTPGSQEAHYLVPGCLRPLLRGLVDSRDRPEDVRLARARMLERTVRLLLSCRAALGGEAPADGLPRTLRFASPSVAAGWLESRLPALMSAARMAVADGELDTLARRLLAALVRALTAAPAATPTLTERYDLHRLVLEIAERRGLHRERAAALINLADLDAEAGRHTEAVARYRAALDAARVCADTEAEGRVLEALGGAHLALRDLPRASDWFGRALALRQARGELGHQARLHARIGSVLTYLGRYGPALREWRSAAGAHRRLGDVPSQARALTEAARVQEYAGHPEDALRTCRDALYWARQAGEQRLEAAVLLRLADTLDRLGDSGGAALQRVAAQRLFRPGEFPAV